MNDPEDQQCYYCEKPLPRTRPAAPPAPAAETPRKPIRLPGVRYDEGDEEPSDRRRSGPRRPAIPPDLTRARQQVSAALFAVGGVFLLCNAIGLAVGAAQAVKEQGDPADPAVLAIVLVIGGALILTPSAAFIGLGIWARYQPLPPAIIGLCLWIPLAILEVVVTLFGEPKGIVGASVRDLILTFILIQAVNTAARAPKPEPPFEEE
jgi:hypothetical protein